MSARLSVTFYQEVDNFQGNVRVSVTAACEKQRKTHCTCKLVIKFANVFFGPLISFVNIILVSISINDGMVDQSLQLVLLVEWRHYKKPTSLLNPRSSKDASNCSMVSTLSALAKPLSRLATISLLVEFTSVSIRPNNLLWHDSCSVHLVIIV